MMILRKFLWFVSVVLCFGLVSVSAQTAPIPKIISAGVVNGKATSMPKPVYPAAAMAVKASGSVNVEIVIDEQGNVESATAVSGHPLLRAAAVEAARQATFAPTQLSGVPVKVKGVIVYNFVSDEKSSETIERPTDRAVVSDSITKTGQDQAFKVDPDSINGGVINGKAISLPVPVYPAAAQAVKASGAVNVRVKIDTQGNVVQAEAVSGHPLLRAAAVEAARQSKFKPTLLAGNPVNVTGIIIYNFNLSQPSPITEGLNDKNKNWATGLFFSLFREADANLLKEMEFGEDFDNELSDMMKEMPEEFSSEKESLEKFGTSKGAERQRLAAELSNSFKKFYGGSDSTEYEVGQITGVIIVQILKKGLALSGKNFQANDALLKENLGKLKTLLESDSLKMTPDSIKSLREMSSYADLDLNSRENIVKLFALVESVFESSEVGK